MSERLLLSWWVPMAVEQHRHHPPKRRTERLDPEFVAMIRIVLVTGALAILLWALNHLL